MVTKNFFAALMATHCDVTSNSAKITDLNGSSYTLYKSTQQKIFSKWNTKRVSGTQDGGVVFAYNDSEPSADDHSIEGFIDGVNLTALRSELMNNSSYTRFNFVYSLTNTTSSDIQINQVYFLAVCQTGTNAYKECLIDHTKLSTPITIPANDSKTVEYTIQINYPTA